MLMLEAAGTGARHRVVGQALRLRLGLEPQLPLGI